MGSVTTSLLSLKINGETKTFSNKNSSLIVEDSFQKIGRVLKSVHKQLKIYKSRINKIQMRRII